MISTMKNIYNTHGYLLDDIRKNLVEGKSVGVPRKVIEKAGFTVDELVDYFKIKPTEDMIVFSGFKV